MGVNLVQTTRPVASLNKRKNPVLLWPAIVADYQVAVMQQHHPDMYDTHVKNMWHIGEIHTAVSGPYVKGINVKYKSEYPGGNAIWCPEDKVWVLRNVWWNDMSCTLLSKGTYENFVGDAGLIRILKSEYRDRFWNIEKLPTPIMALPYNVRDLLKRNGVGSLAPGTRTQGAQGPKGSSIQIRNLNTDTAKNKSPQLVEANNSMRELLKQFDIKLRSERTDLDELAL